MFTSSKTLNNILYGTGIENIISVKINNFEYNIKDLIRLYNNRKDTIYNNPDYELYLLEKMEEERKKFTDIFKFVTEITLKNITGDLITIKLKNGKIHNEFGSAIFNNNFETYYLNDDLLSYKELQNQLRIKKINKLYEKYN